MYRFFYILTMKNILLNSFYGILLILTISSCSQTVYTPLRWQANAITIDGQSNEWPNPLRYYDQASNLSYEMTNDEENIYLVFSSKERSTIRKIMHKGLKFSIDTAMGKNKYPMQFRFPYRNPNDINPFFEDGFSHNDSMNPRHHFNDTTFRHNPNDTTHHHHRQFVEGKPWQPMLKVFTKGINTKRDADSILTIPNEYGIEVAVQRDSFKIFCEIKIPFKIFYKNQISVNDTIKPIFFQVNLDAIEPPDGQRPHPQNGDDNFNAGRGGYGGGHGGHSGGMGGHGGSMGGGGMSRGGMGGGSRGGYGGGGGFGGVPPEGNTYVDTQNNANVIRFQFRPSLLIVSGKK